MPNKEVYNTLVVNIKVNDPQEEEIYNFLLNVPRKRSQIIIFAVKEFIEKYHLEDASNKMVNLFLSEYDPDKAVATISETPVPKKTTEKKKKPKKNKEEGLNESLLDSSLLSQARSQMQMFGV